MTNKEAIKIINNMPNYKPWEVEALGMAIKALERVHTMSEEEMEAYLKDEDLVVVKRKILKKAIKALEQTRWIPLKTRPMTEEEKEEIGFDFDYMYDCPLPDYGQEVLITDCYGNVEIDTFYRDYDGVYFEENCDDGEVVAWMPLPQSYKVEREGEE